MDRMPPFQIKRVDKPQLVIQGSPIAVEDTKVHINVLLHEREIARFDCLRPSTRLSIESEMIRDSKPYLAEEFIRLLRFTSHPASFFPDDLLAMYPPRFYYLLLERVMAEDILILWGQSLDGNRILPFHNHQIQVVIAPVIHQEAYLIAKNKYSVYLYPRPGKDGIRIYRSDFLDLQRATPPPMTFHSEDVFEVFQLTIAQHLGVPVEAMYPKPVERILDRCPECGGVVQHLGGDAHFCLDCEWDNLALIHIDDF